MPSEIALKASEQFWRLLAKVGSEEALIARAAEIIDAAIAEATAPYLARIEQVRARRDHLQSEAANGNPFAQQVYGETACVLAILDGAKEQPHG